MSERPRQSKKLSIKNKHVNQNIKNVLMKLYTQIVKKNSRAAHKIEWALASLRKYPLNITSGKECLILNGFDKALCEYVDEHLFNKKTENESVVVQNKGPVKVGHCLNLPQTSKQMNVTTVNEEVNMIYYSEQISVKTADNEAKTNNHSEQMNVKTTEKEAKINNLSEMSLKQNNQVKQPVYCKTNNKIAALMIALHNQELEYPSRPALNMKELMIKVQKYCIFKIEDWGFVTSLQRKPTYLKSEKRDGIKMYSLTDLGIKASNIVLSNQEPNHIPNNDHTMGMEEEDHRVPPFDSDVIQAPFNSVNDFPLFIDLPPGSYEVVMLVDKNEPEMLSKGNNLITVESRSLKVGDIVWVARSKTDGQELVLPFIIERKRMDDFAASIKDGRFHEQKFRLKKCGIRNVIYLIEDHEGNKNCGLPMATLNQAKINTRVQDGFLVHHTNSLAGTKVFLNMITVRLTNELKNIHLRGTNTEIGGRELMTFEHFNISASKTKPLTVKELFLKMLLQLKGLSVMKALAITKTFSSPSALMDAYDNLDVAEAEMLLANLRFNEYTPRVSPAISKIIYHLFNKKISPS